MAAYAVLSRHGRASRTQAAAERGLKRVARFWNKHPFSFYETFPRIDRPSGRFWNGRAGFNLRPLSNTHTLNFDQSPRSPRSAKTEDERKAFLDMARTWTIAARNGVNGHEPRAPE